MFEIHFRIPSNLSFICRHNISEDLKNQILSMPDFAYLISEAFLFEDRRTPLKAANIPGFSGYPGPSKGRFTR